MASCSSLKKGACSQILLVAVLFSTVTSSLGGACSKIWENPCNHQLPVRHMRSAATKNQLIKVSSMIDKWSLRQLERLYPTGLPLPEVSDCPKFQKMMRPIRQAKDLKTANLAFYTSMIKFAIFLDKLENVEIQTHHQFDKEKRRNIFDTTCNNIKTTICEYKDFLSKKQKIPVAILERSVHVNTRCLPKVANLTSIQGVEIQFFKKLNKFFKQSKRELQKLKKKLKNRRRNRLRNRKNLSSTTEKIINKLFNGIESS